MVKSRRHRSRKRSRTRKRRGGEQCVQDCLKNCAKATEALGQAKKAISSAPLSFVS